MRKTNLIKSLKKNKSLLFITSFLLVMACSQIKPVEAHISHQEIAIHGDVMLDYPGGAFARTGLGTEEDPYVIENYEIFPDETHGFFIEDTTKHLIIKDCIIGPMLYWNFPYWGIMLENCSNVKIENCIIRPWPSYPDFIPSYGGINLLDCFNCTVSNCEIAHDASLRGYLTFGIRLENTHNSTIGPNNAVAAHWGLNLSNSRYNEIIQNTFGGKSIETHIAVYGTNNMWGISWDNIVLEEGSTHNLISQNYCWLYSSTGMYLINNVRFNTIINNQFFRDPLYVIYSGAGAVGQPYLETVGPNYMHRINSPENKTYMGPQAPAPGFYPSSEPFEVVSDGSFPSASYWSRSGTGTGNIVSQKVDKDGNLHKKVLYCNSKDSGSGFDVSITGRMESFWWSGDGRNDGTIEFWVAPVNTNIGSISCKVLNSGSGTLAEIKFSSGTIFYRDSSTMQNSSMTYEDNKWYRISLNYSCYGGYAGLGGSQYQFQIFDSDGKRVLYTSPVASYDAMGPSDGFQINVKGDSVNYCTAYVDAIGYSWDDHYDVGNNSMEGMFLDFNSQIHEFEFIFMNYQIDDGPWIEFYNPDDYGNYDFYDPVIIPLPEDDGGHSIQLTGFDNVRANYYYSNPVDFTTYYKKDIFITEHSENGIVVAAANNFVSSGVVMLNIGEDLNVSFNCFTYFLDTTNKTWTNVSLFYKINGDPLDPAGWTGPNPMGSGNDTVSTNFTIDKGNYDYFDNVYYYIQMEQYNDSNYLDSYFWTSDGVIKYDVLKA
ncbi:MAG: right-handed parallel beta-helix repeat-containing protein, partial [Candidatus Hodarchaeota archaeon]